MSDSFVVNKAVFSNQPQQLMKCKRAKNTKNSFALDVWYNIYQYLPMRDLYSLCHTSKKIREIITSDFIRREDFSFIFKYDGTNEWLDCVRKKHARMVSFFFQNVGAKINRIINTGIIGERRLLADILPSLCVHGSAQVMDEILSVPAVQAQLKAGTNRATHVFHSAACDGHTDIMDRILQVPNLELNLRSQDIQHPCDNEKAIDIFNFYRNHQLGDARS
jgi:hypothetical protein